MNKSASNRGCVRWLGVSALAIVALMVLFRGAPNWGESLYGKGLFPIVRRMLDLISIPVPGIYLTLIGLVFVIILISRRLFDKSRSFKARLLRFGKMILGLLSVLLIWFYLFWGFNYSRPDIVDRMQLDSALPDTTWLFDEIDQVIQSANEIRARSEMKVLDNLSLDDILSTNLDVDKINKELESILPAFKYDIKIRPRLQFLEPDGFLLHWSTSGIYWPFTGESNVDRGVHYIRKPVTVAHELAHAHGLTSEGDCNFVAYLVCRDSDVAIHQYSAHLSYLGYLMRDALKIKGRKGLSVFYDKMSPEVKQDRENIYNHHETYPDYFPKLRNKVYDSYLKSQGVKGGISSYNYFVKLKYNWDQRVE